ncbi:MAG: hypothetical protein ACLPT4_14060 [Verrucomicrobiia bacterium]
MHNEVLVWIGGRLASWSKWVLQRIPYEIVRKDRAKADEAKIEGNQLVPRDVRLAAVVQARVLMFKINSVRHDAARCGMVAMECDNWLNENGLYLPKAMRYQFYRSVRACQLLSDCNVAGHRDADLMRLIREQSEQAERGVQMIEEYIDSFDK